MKNKTYQVFAVGIVFFAIGLLGGCDKTPEEQAAIGQGIKTSVDTIAGSRLSEPPQSEDEVMCHLQCESLMAEYREYGLEKSECLPICDDVTKQCKDKGKAEVGNTCIYFGISDELKNRNPSWKSPYFDE
ncbi:MAG: hypothetical protein ACKUBY_03690 [Candidatus Moraniibacteriota bacterium]